MKSKMELFWIAVYEFQKFTISCEFAGQECAPDDFKLMYTDFGGCFVFNWKPDKMLMVSDTGSNVGLKVTLNLEQYEYMPGNKSIM